MPVLGNKESDIKIVLPSSTAEDEAWVTVKSRLLLRDLIEVEESSPENQYRQTIASLANYITAWNFTDNEGNVVPITEDAILDFSQADYNYITEHLGKALAAAQGVAIEPDQKKTSSSTLTPSTPVIPHPSA